MTQTADISELAYALGIPDGAAIIRSVAEDFKVDEQLGFEPSGDGPHCLLQIEKEGNTTAWVARELARANKLEARDVGYCGLKDRHAITRQWFSLPCAGEPLIPDDAGIRLLSSVRNRRKLRRGAHRSNCFVIRLRECTVSLAYLTQRTELVALSGFPNYFGPQRFGRNGHNLALADSLFAGKSLKREPRGFAISAARSAIFNSITSERVETKLWAQPLQGDQMNLDGSGSVFAYDCDDASLGERLLSGDIHPAATLWGRQGSALSDRAADIENAVATRDWSQFTSGFSAQKVDSSLRAMRCMPRDLLISTCDGDPVLRFELSRGSFATALLRELVGETVDAQSAT